MDSSIQKILQKHSVDSVFHSHVSMGHTRGKYNFNRQDLEEFWKVYMNTIEKNPTVSIGVAEKPQHYLPVLVDIDIKVKEDEEDSIDELHNDKHIKETINVYQSVLRNIVEDCTDKHLLCVVLEKDLYRITKNGITYAKHGFHLHFPNCFLNKVDQEVHLIPRAQILIQELKVFEDIGFEDSSKLIDKASCTNPWLLYGARKQNDMDPYILSKIYNSEGVEVTLEKAFRKYKIYDLKEQSIKIKGKVKQYLPRILSIIPYGRDVCEVRHGLISPLKEKLKEVRKNTKEYKKKSVTHNLEAVSKLLPMLSDFRAEDRNEWMTIGWALFNISEGCHEGLDLWCDFSSRCEEHYDEAVCMYQWDRMVTKEITLGTIAYYASIDSPEKYKEYQREQADKYMHESLGGSHNDIAKILYAEYGNEFVCASIASKSWFQFKGHCWEPIEDGIFLRKKISGDIVERFLEVGKEILTQLSGATDKGDNAMYETRFKQVQNMIKSLKSSPFKSNVMKENQEVFYDKRFREKLDTNPALFPFNNGVYDLNLNIFRPGRPEDFISKTAPIDYDPDMDENDEGVQSIHDYLEKVFPDKSIRKYFLDISSDIFYGGNNQKQVYFWTGEGDNAKSVTQGFFEKMLGKLSIKFNTTVITGKKVQSGAANPELARAGGGVRMATLEEPNSDEMINIGILKNLSGNDTYYARDLFEKGKEGREITPMFKLVFICNKLPKLKYSDKATWNRIRVIPFESTFCRPDDPAPESFEEQLRQKRFPMDKEFGEKIPGLLKAFAWVLLNHRKHIKERFEPEKVRMATAVYRKQNDIYRQFVEECIAEESDKYINLTELYLQFKEWFRDSLPSHTVPIKNEVEEYFTRLWDEPTKGKKWKGYRIRTLQDDIDDGEVIILDDDDLVDYTDGTNLPPM